MGAANHATITFGTCTAGSATATHFGIGHSTSGAGGLLFSGALTNSVTIGLGNPVASFAAGALTVTASGLEADLDTELLALIFQNANIANIGDATGLRGSSTAGNLFISLHSSNPTGGSQTTNEISYTGYGRVAVTRDTSGWDVT